MMASYSTVPMPPQSTCLLDDDGLFDFGALFDFERESTSEVNE
jgi:hypothetical protein